MSATESDYHKLMAQFERIAKGPVDPGLEAVEAFLGGIMRLLHGCRDILWIFPAILMGVLQETPLEDLRAEIGKLARALEDTVNPMFGEPTTEERLRLVNRMLRIVEERRDEHGK